MEIKIEEKFQCSKCNEVKPMQTSGGTGYARNDKDEKICYACCAIDDKAYMLQHNKIALYLTKRTDGGYEVTNWPGTLCFNVYASKQGGHNVARTRIDAWFRVDGKPWHAVQYGEWNQIAHCKAVRS